jgi:hypothetical protein
MDKSQIGIAGEFYVLAQLTHRGFIATLTLGNTKGVDILVTNQELNKLYKVEVKTTSQKLRREKLFGEGQFHVWAMSSKHEDLNDKNLVYVLVVIGNPDAHPKFFVIPSSEVSRYVKWQHEYWLQTRTNPVKDTSMRNFRIEAEDPKGYQDNWIIFEE